MRSRANDFVFVDSQGSHGRELSHAAARPHQTLEPQRHRRIDPRGARRRQVAREQRGGAEAERRPPTYVTQSSALTPKSIDDINRVNAGGAGEAERDADRRTAPARGAGTAR